MIDKLKLEIKVVSYRCHLIRKLSKKESKVKSQYQKELVYLKDQLRSLHLAYAFIRGMPYSILESNCKESPDWNSVESHLVMHVNRTRRQFILEQEMGTFYIKTALDKVLKQALEDWKTT